MKKKNSLYLLIAPLYILVFFIAEGIVPEEGAFVSYLPLDDRIPFAEIFVIPYVLWYPLLVGVGIALLIKDGINFKRYMSFLGIAFFSVIILNIIFPNKQLLRPDPMPRDNFFTAVIEGIYKADTNTNVLPSMHVIGCIGATLAVFQSKIFKRIHRVSILILSILICASTVLIKQHSVLDVITALPYGAIVAVICYKYKFSTS